MRNGLKPLVPLFALSVTLLGGASSASAAGCSNVDQCATSTCRVQSTTYNCKSDTENEYKLEGFPPKLVTYTFKTCQCPEGKNPRKYRKQVSPAPGSAAEVEVVESDGSTSIVVADDPSCEETADAQLLE